MLNSKQIEIANILKNEMTKAGITNPFMQTAILGIAYKESMLNPAAQEVSYAKTSNDRIRNIFAKAKGVSDAQLDALKKDKVAFFDFVYNGIIGNGPKDGYLFRGRGFNQLTGRANYKAYGDSLGVDLVSNPDLVSTPEIASKVVISFMKKGVDTLKKLGKFSGKDINDVPDLKTAYNTVYNVNAGAGKNLYDAQGNIKNDSTGGYKTGKDSLDFISKAIIGVNTAITETATAAAEEVKKKPLSSALIACGIIVLGYIIYKKIQTT